MVWYGTLCQAMFECILFRQRMFDNVKLCTELYHIGACNVCNSRNVCNTSQCKATYCDDMLRNATCAFVCLHIYIFTNMVCMYTHGVVFFRAGQQSLLRRPTNVHAKVETSVSIVPTPDVWTGPKR